MAVPAPTGEESCNDAVAPKRSRRRRPSGRSAHHQRPFGRGLGQTGRGDQGDPEGPSGKTGLAPPGFEPPLLESAQRAHPPCPAAARHTPLHRVLDCQRGSKPPTKFEQGRNWAMCCSIRDAAPGCSFPTRCRSGVVDLRWSPCPTAVPLIAPQRLVERPEPNRSANRKTQVHKCKHPPTKPPEGANVR